MVTFVRITNRNIFDKLESIEKQVFLINGKVKLNRWTASIALIVALSVAGIAL